MDRTSASTCFFFVLLFLFTCNPTATSTKLNSQLLDDEGVCALVNCVEGTCVLSNGSLLGFECQCNSGWKKMPPWPTCFLPNCSVNFQCGNGAPPPPITLPPLFNLSDPCNIVFCGSGNCAANGNKATCNCDDGYANMFGDPALPCVLECFLGGDCDNLGFGPPPPPPPPPKSDSPGNGTPSPPLPPPPGTSGSVRPVVNGVLTSWRIACTIAVALMAVFLSNWA